MNATGLKALFLAIYLGVDVLYVLASRSFYESRVSTIQGSGYPDKMGIWLAAGLSYAFLGLGWWFLVANTVVPAGSYQKTAFVAMIYALAVYGVFNGTLYVMFEGWDLKVVVRDFIWGLSWIVGVSLLFHWQLRRALLRSKK
jgi:uncharacterized membrane protein